MAKPDSNRGERLAISSREELERVRTEIECIGALIELADELPAIAQTGLASILTRWNTTLSSVLVAEGARHD
ncbi:hypothetical protein [uncultured Thiodictyon sp.]|uniref:hypothetical protein n=1 Tax=uncultured Thiodictyon sp. TaxID=1846217 RepID=UPI0025D14EF6|nr:hypothetical protein [uncultured Thiodictyon sp.]